MGCTSKPAAAAESAETMPAPSPHASEPATAQPPPAAAPQASGSTVAKIREHFEQFKGATMEEHKQ
eukprot:scaffold373_cov421-Prasinococcus_capsulatus_cf.AAC.5